MDSKSVIMCCIVCYVCEPWCKLLWSCLSPSWKNACFPCKLCGPLISLLTLSVTVVLFVIGNLRQYDRHRVSLRNDLRNHLQVRSLSYEWKDLSYVRISCCVAIPRPLTSVENFLDVFCQVTVFFVTSTLVYILLFRLCGRLSDLSRLHCLMSKIFEIVAWFAHLW